MDKRLIGKIAGIVLFVLGAGLMVTKHPILVALMVIGAGVYYLSEKIF